ncbi:MAG TPA: cytochrome P450 [Longimicrobiales bacterium]|nr:cytochrome P450 [Longimicrobiales bacterium]
MSDEPREGAPAAGPERGADAGATDPPRKGAARAGVLDLLRLGARIAGAALRPGEKGDPGAAGCRWARELMDREGARSLEVKVPGRRVRIVGHPEPSEELLSGAPHAGGAGVGAPKKKAMSFLAPGALTVAEGPTWARLRAFNERVLCPGKAHPFADAFLRVVRREFAEPVRDPDDVRAAMGRSMVGIVLGEVDADADPATDAAVLFDVVQSPLRRKLLGFLYAGRRERLFRLLGEVYDASGDGRPTLLARARSEAGDLSREEVLQQVPHWMFTFTGSGTDLLGRTLALITARPEAHRRAVEEIREAGVPGDPAGVYRLRWLEACLREAGRLFPPVTKTFHRVGDGSGDGGTEAAHWFPLLQRDPDLGPTVDDFRPERWTEPEPDAAARASNLFLRGPRACPGEELILFVCKAALARQLGEAGLAPRASRLSRDPLPVSFPEGEARFTTQEDA